MPTSNQTCSRQLPKAEKPISHGVPHNCLHSAVHPRPARRAPVLSRPQSAHGFVMLCRALAASSPAGCTTCSTWSATSGSLRTSF
uniref:Uncharacterized protein n=1 Tax=Macrostomum lignano TaxID=282301 RepID=A0A1I8F4Y4_9PLAT